MDNRLQREEIIRGRKNIDLIFNNGKRVTSSGISVVWIKSISRKVAFFVSSRSGNAVTRNRIKRLLRESYRLNKAHFPLNISLIFNISNEMADPTFKNIQTSIIDIANQISAKIE